MKTQHFDSKILKMGREIRDFKPIPFHKAFKVEINMWDMSNLGLVFTCFI